MKLLIPYVVFMAVALSMTGCKQEPPPSTAPTAKSAPTPAGKAEGTTATPAMGVASGVTVASITLGTAIGADKKVTTAAETFVKSDPIYAAVELTGTGNASVTAKWTRNSDGKISDVSEARENIYANGSAVSTFNASTLGGWVPGNYQVEILVDNIPAGTKSFIVK